MQNYYYLLVNNKMRFFFKEKYFFISKLIFLIGASPVEVDSGRGLRAEQWARFCARYSCAEVIEKCSRTRLLEKTTSCRWSHDSLSLEKAAVARAKTNPLQQSNSGCKN